MWAKRSSSISGSALLRNSSAQVFCSRFALAGGTRNSDSNRLPWGTRGRNIVLLSSPVYATATVAYPILYIRWPTSGRGFYGGINIPFGSLSLSTPPSERLPLPDLRTVAGAPPQAPSPGFSDPLNDVLRKQQWSGKPHGT